MRSNFVDKVYDTYITSDFTYGTDNLNPVREIDLSDNKSIDDKIAEIYAELNKRVDNIKKTVSVLTGDSDEDLYQGNTTSENNSDEDNFHFKNVIGLTGSAGDKIVVVPAFEEDMDPLTLEIEIMMLEKTIQAYYPDGDPTTVEGSGGNPDIPDIELPPFIPDCIVLSGESSKANANELSEIQDDTDDNNLGGTPAKKDGKVNSDAPTISAGKLSDAVSDALNAAEKASSDNLKEQADCAKAELGILKMILAVLKVIKMIKQMMDPALTIIMQAIKIVQLAVQCWNNPTCIAVIIQRVMGTVIAILMSVVGQLIAQIWKMLGMDCFSAQAQAIMDEIREALAAIGSIISELDPTGIITDVKGIASAIMDTVDSLKNNISNMAADVQNMKDNPKLIGENMKATLKTSLNKALEDAGLGGLTDEQYADFIKNKRYRARIFSALSKVAPEAVSDLQSAVDSVLSIPETIAETWNTIANITNSFSKEEALMQSWSEVTSI